MYSAFVITIMVLGLCMLEIYRVIDAKILKSIDIVGDEAWLDKKQKETLQPRLEWMDS